MLTEDSYGTNTPSWAYSSTGGYSGGEETLSVSGYSSGTADLTTTLDNGNCSPTVVAGNFYTASIYYESNAPVYITLYTRNDSSTAWSYGGQSVTFPVATSWTEATFQFQVPSGVNGAGFGMTLQQNGTVSTSDYSLVNDGSSPPPAAGAGVNALQNPELTSAPGGLPTCFTEDSYGTNTPSWAYSSTGGYTGDGEETLSVSGYGSGTADLTTTLDDGNCAPTVVAGNTYTATVFYESNAPVYITLYTRNASNDAWSYGGQSVTFPAATSWTEATYQFQIPSGVNGAGFGMTLQQNGTVSTSDYSLVNDGSSPPPAAAVDVNALQNPDLTSAPGGLPTCFTEDSYGTNSTSWAYNPTGGYGGGEETLTVTGYGSGTADLIPTLDDGNCAPTVVPGNTYTATVFYESNAPVYITLYTRNATTNAWSYAGQTATFSASPTWTEADDQFQIPSGVNGVSFGMTLQENGTVSTSGYSFVNDGLYSAPTVTVSGPTDATSGAVQYSVTVSGSGVAPTGSVVVSDGQSGSCTISSLTNGTGSCSIDETAAGSPYSVTASYSGDIYYPPATGSTTEDVT